MINSIALQDYHDICCFHLSRWHNLSISTNVPVKLQSIRHFSGLEYEKSFEIAFAPDCGVDDGGWSTEDPIIERLWNPYVYMPFLAYLSGTDHRMNSNQEGTLIMNNDWLR